MATLIGGGPRVLLLTFVPRRAHVMDSNVLFLWCKELPYCTSLFTYFVLHSRSYAVEANSFCLRLRT